MKLNKENAKHATNIGLYCGRESKARFSAKAYRVNQCCLRQTACVGLSYCFYIFYHHEMRTFFVVVFFVRSTLMPCKKTKTKQKQKTKTKQNKKPEVTSV